MNAIERRAAWSLASIYALRMLGLFLILPVFALAAEDMPGATPIAIGLAIGIYGLTQALLQIPGGLLSDRIGRKPVIVIGLLLFAAGSVLAAVATDIWWTIAGRALQGSGAIAASIMALAADLSRERQRTKIMAVIGMSIGLSFMLALVAGPVLNEWLGLSGIFWLTALLALGGVLVVTFIVPSPGSTSIHLDTQTVPGQIKQVLGDGQLIRLDAGILLLHLMLTAVFISVPGVLVHQLGIPLVDHWQLYLGVLVLSLVTMVPFIILAERRHQIKPVFLGAIATLGIAMLVFSAQSASWFVVVLALWLFFSGFNLLEALLPSLVSKVAPVASKGTAMGVYSSSQFFGAFLGGMMGGVALEYFGAVGVFYAAATIALLWLLIAAGMRRPDPLKRISIRLGQQGDSNPGKVAAQLLAVPGIVEAAVTDDCQIAHLKVDRQKFDEAELERFAVG